MASPRLLHRVVARSLLAAIVAISSVANATAAELGPAEQARLLQGQQVVREETLDTGGGRYIGGAAYVLVNAPPQDVDRVLDDVRDYRQILPYTRSARWIGLSRKGDMLVELEQGNSLAHGRYTLRIHREPEPGGASMVHFWLDRRFSHDIADASGFFRIEPTDDGRTLLTYVALVDLGPGIVQRLFEGRIRRVLLSAPVLVRDYVQARLARR